MGRQYNYFISPEEELDFMKELFDNDFIVLKAQEVTKDNHVVWDWRVLQLQDDKKDQEVLKNFESIFNMLSRTYIYKKEWGELKNNKELYWDMVNGCPVIEHCHCRINEEHNSLSSGRFYLNTWYKDEMESFDTVYKGFQKLVRMMKKRIVYKRHEIEFENGKTMHWPASQQAVDLIKNGCKIGL